MFIIKCKNGTHIMITDCNQLASNGSQTTGILMLGKIDIHFNKMIAGEGGV